MVRTQKSVIEKEAPKKRGGRQSGAKTYNKTTLLKLIKRYKPTNSVLWGTVAEQYRVECGEIEARPSLTIKKFFIQKMCNNLRKPTGSSGVDDITAQSQAIFREMLDEEEACDEGDNDNEDFEDNTCYEDNNNDVDYHEDEDNDDASSSTDNVLNNSSIVKPSPTISSVQLSQERSISSKIKDEFDVKHMKSKNSKNSNDTNSQRSSIRKEITAIGDVIAKSSSKEDSNMLLYMQLESKKAEERERSRREEMILRQEELKIEREERREERRQNLAREQQFQMVF
jgi:hypothetical protein